MPKVGTVITDNTRANSSNHGYYQLEGPGGCSLDLNSCHNAFVFVYSDHDTVNVNEGNANSVNDMGQGTTINIGNGYLPALIHLPTQHLTISDFQHDPTGVLNINSTYDRVTSDGHGGAKVFFLGGVVDVLNDPHPNVVLHTPISPMP